jgi:hypothetical protein
MKKLGGAVTAIAVAGLLVAIAATPSHADALKRTYVRSHAYDGLWSVSIRTQYGPCDASYRYPARIVGGQVVQAGSDFSYQISGAVVSSGAIAVTVSKGLGSATGYGRLRGGSGGGRWSAGNNQCYGTWSAMRRASN